MHTSSRPFSLYRLGLSALATLAFLAGPAVALSKNCPVPNSFCIYSFNDEQGNAVFTIHSSATGWAAIGTGTAMAASSMVVGWANGTGGYTISNRLSTAHAMPTVAATQFATLMPLQVPAPQWATLAFLLDGILPLALQHSHLLEITYMRFALYRLQLTVL
ncbi:hypothetical protein BASA83_006464 [Batrachochytrium salamandrivorans]|nr:hypothetical protein BASA83_006464 [Batrachochytrium salamandrivorans]